MDKKLLNFIHQVEKILKIKPDTYGLSFINANKMKQLNKKYRHKDKTTDILTFRMADTKETITVNFLGDIYINKDMVSKQKNYYSYVMNLIIHGFLHLLGQDHKNDEQLNKMINIQKKILNKLNIR